MKKYIIAFLVVSHFAFAHQTSLFPDQEVETPSDKTSTKKTSPKKKRSKSKAQKKQVEAPAAEKQAEKQLNIALDPLQQDLPLPQGSEKTFYDPSIQTFQKILDKRSIQSKTAYAKFYKENKREKMEGGALFRIPGYTKLVFLPRNPSKHYKNWADWSSVLRPCQKAFSKF